MAIKFSGGIKVPQGGFKAKDDSIGDPFFNDVTLLLHLDGSNGSTTFTDSSNSGHTPTQVGSSTISTTQSKFGGSSLIVPADTDGVAVPSSTDFTFGTADFTLECWVYPTTNSSSFHQNLIGLDNYAANQSFNFFIFSDRIRLWSAAGATSNTNTLGASAGPATLTFNDWNHVALTRESGTGRIFINGILNDTSSVAAISGTFGLTRGLAIGRSNLATVGLRGNSFMDDVRITKGIARYTANFTPPTTAFPDS